jgi:hypothetical protein
VSELAKELGRRRIVVSVPPSSLAGTSAVTSEVPRTEATSVRAPRVLRVRVSEVEAAPADGTRGPCLSATLESGSADFTAEYSSGRTGRTFPEAQLELKRAILEDPSFTAWLLASPDR